QPSLYEGFGIPILEAYQCGCPVFLNNKSVFPEIAGDAAVFFELDNEQQNLSEKLEAFLSYTDAQKNALIEKQQKRLEFFSWKKSAEKLNEVYLSVLK
ncbi:MAG: glycosyltransferase, partial [Bacteroidales bacterium]|nr:glycosyltransferase [Bacteroidales bacterium]